MSDIRIQREKTFDPQTFVAEAIQAMQDQPDAKTILVAVDVNIYAQMLFNAHHHPMMVMMPGESEPKPMVSPYCGKLQVVVREDFTPGEWRLA